MAELITCPRCQTRLRLRAGTDPGEFSCPRCLAPLDETRVTAQPPAPGNWRVARPGPSGRGSSLDVEAHHGLWLVYFGALALTVLCILGLVAWLAGTNGLGLEVELAVWVLALLFFVLDVLVLIPISRWSFLPATRPDVGPGRTALRMIGGVALLLIVSGALVVFFFVTCLYAVMK